MGKNLYHCLQRLARKGGFRAANGTTKARHGLRSEGVCGRSKQSVSGRSPHGEEHTRPARATPDGPWHDRARAQASSSSSAARPTWTSSSTSTRPAASTTCRAGGSLVYHDTGTCVDDARWPPFAAAARMPPPGSLAHSAIDCPPIFFLQNAHAPSPAGATPWCALWRWTSCSPRAP